MPDSHVTASKLDPASEAAGNDDLAQLCAARAGSRAALIQLLERCRNYLLLVANAELPDEVRPKIAPSDLVQESLADGWEAFGGFRGTNGIELRSWLRNILLNNLRDANRAYLATAKRNVQREVPLPAELSGDACCRWLVADDPSPSACAETNEELRLIERALSRLPERYAEIIRLRNIEYLPFAEIAARMDIKLGLARKLWERAVRRMAQELKVRRRPR